MALSITMFERAVGQFPGEGRPNPILGELYQLVNTVNEFFVSNDFTKHPAASCPGVASTGRQVGEVIPSGFDFVGNVSSQVNNCAARVGQSLGSIYSNASTFTMPPETAKCIQENLAGAARSFCSTSNIVYASLAIALAVIIVLTVVVCGLYKGKSSQPDLEYPTENQSLMGPIIP